MPAFAELGAEDDVVVGRARGHHRVHLLAVVDAEVDHDRPVVDRVGLLDRGHDVGHVVDAQTDAAHRFRPLHVVGEIGRQVHLAVALLVEELLPLPHHAQVRVVQDRDLDRDAFGRRGHELLRRHLEAAVAVDRPHHAIGPAHLGADGGRHRVAHRAEPTGVDPRVRQLELPELARPHLVLADARDEDRVVRGVLTQHLDAVLRLQRAAVLLRVLERELLLPRSQRRAPLREVRRAVLLLLGLHRLDELVDDDLAVTDDRHVRLPDLAELGRIDVDVDDLGVQRERRGIAGDAVVEARTERHEQVRLLHRGDRGVVAVHARHTEAERVLVRERAARP